MITSKLNAQRKLFFILWKSFHYVVVFILRGKKKTKIIKINNRQVKRKYLGVLYVNINGKYI